MVGGDEGIYNEEGVLKAIGDKVGYMGPIGAGTIAKLVHNMIRTLRGLIAEGFTLGVKAGVKPERSSRPFAAPPSGQGLMLSQMIPT
jgi:3-hydroxyisobutyrate dehydrogenase